MQCQKLQFTVHGASERMQEYLNVVTFKIPHLPLIKSRTTWYIHCI